ncbi:BTAD domain-containing putative transcriptional regulator [Streptomyces sp. 7-21]|uniref:BTAD domain-containing putative transcriptional regulator n=1 Tax=Streptomyces sp. 7-21 TaxID=2802283 RepID=UPI00191E8187|nr:BTAD domain-containing putative transcriptional regulator [Streptomyces sp. 7-21]MBL1066423.1 LysM peptidoglycan-binding domain-containing protein [Streptomyces sp. 7-21]
MAQPIPSGGGNRTPAQVKVGRSFGDVLKAVLAFIALLCLVAGVPLSLAYFIGWPLPDEAPTWDMLQDEITASALLKVLAVMVWVAWAQFTACVLVEVHAAVTGIGLPRRVPGAGPSQLLARQLVSALLLISSAAASVTPVLSDLPSAFDSSGPSVVAEQQEETPGQERGQSPGQAVADPAMNLPEEGRENTAGQSTKFYRIQPPEGRHHDTLWGIAERHLGDGLRYKEIYQLNKDRVQPDGSRLTEASLIRPGWILEMPADAHGGELVEMPDEAEELSAEEAAEYEEYQRTGGGERPDGPGGETADETSAERADLPRPDGPGGPGTGGGDAPAENAQQAPVIEDPADSADPAGPGGSGGGESDASGESAGFGLPEALIAAPLLAAGLLVALGRTRRNALWQAAAGTLGRGVGDGLAPGTPETFNARDALLVGADPEAVAFLDRALRVLSAALDAQGRALPPVYAAWLGEKELHLQLAAPAGAPPEPWRTGQGETYWMIERDGLDGAPEPGAEAPYPGLVSLGMRDGLRLLLNLEAVPGLVSVRGTPADREAVLASIAAELATSGWSDRMTVTLVGFGADLTALAPTRVRCLDDVAGLLEVMETETNLRRGALRHAGHDTILTGRTGPARQQQWAPHLVIIGTAPSQEEADRLAGLASVSAPLGIGYLVASDRPDLPGAAWEFEITPDGRLREPVMDLELSGQLLPAAHRAAVVGLFTELTAPPAGDGGQRAAAPAFTVDLTERGKPEVYARLLGGYELTGLPEPEPERAAQLREALAVLLLHREGVHPRVLAAALWPRGVSDDVRDALIDRLRGWLGTGADGEPRLRRTADGRLTLSPRVFSDWDVLRTLHHQAVSGRSGAPAAQRERQLSDALSMAAGPLLDGQRESGGYGWLDHEIVDAQYPLLVADIALMLSGEQIAAGRGEQAYAAVRTALGAAPMDERLWNALLRAAHATGRREWLTGAAEWLVAHHRQLYGEGRSLPAETEALLDELLPAWRAGSAAT